MAVFESIFYNCWHSKLAHFKCILLLTLREKNMYCIVFVPLVTGMQRFGLSKGLQLKNSNLRSLKFNHFMLLCGYSQFESTYNTVLVYCTNSFKANRMIEIQTTLEAESLMQILFIWLSWVKHSELCEKLAQLCWESEKFYVNVSSQWRGTATEWSW